MSNSDPRKLFVRGVFPLTVKYLFDKISEEQNVVVMTKELVGELIKDLENEDLYDIPASDVVRSFFVKRKMNLD